MISPTIRPGFADLSYHTPWIRLIVQGISHWSSWLLWCDSIRMTITQQKSRWSHKNVGESRNPDGGLEIFQQRTENDSAPFQRHSLRILEKENFVLRIIRLGAKASSPLTFPSSRSPFFWRNKSLSSQPLYRLFRRITVSRGKPSLYEYRYNALTLLREGSWGAEAYDHCRSLPLVYFSSSWPVKFRSEEKKRVFYRIYLSTVENCRLRPFREESTVSRPINVS